MRVAVIGGTNFVGPAIVEELIVAGHEPIVIHRGTSEPDDLPSARHIHCDRRDAAALGRALHELAPDAVVDTCAHARPDAEALAVSLPANTRAVVLSSMDVYRAFGALDRGTDTDPVPLYEDSPVREERYLRRGHPVSIPGIDPDPHSYEKLDVEPIVLSLGAVVLRVPMVYGPRDYRRREEFRAAACTRRPAAHSIRPGNAALVPPLGARRRARCSLGRGGSRH